jgi:hypothetical protein
MAGSESFRRAVNRFFHDYLSAVGGRSPFGRLVRRAMKDPVVRKRFLETPKEVLAEAGVVLPEELEVTVLENTDKVIHLVLPPLVESDRVTREER